MQPKDPLDFVSTDMTLALGAESYIRRRHPGRENLAVDPVGAQCLTSLIDIVVNSKVCFVALPSHDDYGSRPALIEGLTALKMIPDCATVRLRPAVEKRIFRAFWEVLDTLGPEWMGQWLRSQFWNPVVSRHHHPRLGSRARTFVTITDEGWDLWRQFIEADRMQRLSPLSMSMPDEDYLREDADRAGGMTAFQYCYAFDIFRRGWQYAERTRNTNLDMTYYPHQFRYRALAGASDAWLETSRDVAWSWGRCIVHAIDAAPNPVDPAQVVDWINALIDARPPRWIQLPEPAHGTEDPKYRRELRDLIDKLEAIARRAQIPRTLVRPASHDLRLGAVPLEAIIEHFHLVAINSALHILPVQEVLDPVLHRVGEALKDVVNFYQRGTFGYPGLIGESFRSQAAPPKEVQFLI
jgi:hypothetical protein